MSGEQLATSGKVIYRVKSQYQTVQLLDEAGGVLLALNGSPQVHTEEEALYHEMIATLPAMLVPQLQSVLILGGGDGLAARNLLRFQEVRSITLVELDAEVLRLGREVPIWREVSAGSLLDPRVQVVCGDGFAWLFNSTQKFDLIIHDLEVCATDQPGGVSVTENLDFLKALQDHLTPHGMWVLTISDDPEHVELVDKTFREMRKEAPLLYKVFFLTARGTIRKAKRCLSVQSEAVRCWSHEFPILGLHTTFYAGNAPIDRFYRWPSPKPAFFDQDILKKLG